MGDRFGEFVREVYEGAVALAEPERRQFIAERCASDVSVRNVVHEIIRDDPTGACLHDDDTWASIVTRATLSTEAPTIPNSGDSIPPDVTGVRIGPYRIERLLGAGGMGNVYEAWDERLERRVALKSIRHDWSGSSTARARFLREARVLSSLDHPNICRIYDVLEEDGRTFLVLEFIEGESLDDARGRLTRAERLQVGDEIAQALAAAHASGVVHRDLKPENIHVTREGRAKVLDFGIARPAEAEKAIADGDAPAQTSNAALTVVGGVIGTPRYMSPEQRRAEEATSASDMFSYGLVLEELLGGERRHSNEGTHGPIRMRRDVRALISALQSERPSNRPSAAETCVRFTRIRSRTRRRLIQAAVAAIALAGVAGGAKYTIDVGRERAIAVEARGDAEELTSHMVGALVDELRSVGRLDAMSGVAERVLAYYESRDVTSLSDEELLSYVKGLQLVGEVELEGGDLEGAARAFTEQQRVGEQLVAQDPGDGANLKALGATHFYLGAIAYRRVDLDSAMAEFERYLEIAEDLVAMDASNPEWRLELAYAQTNLVQINQDRGRLDEARHWLDLSLETKRQLVEMDPEDRSRVFSLANSLTMAREIRGRSSDWDSARDAAEEALALLTKLAERHPRDADVRYRLALAHVHLGEFLEERRDWSGALERHLSSLDELRFLLDLDPSNAEWMREKALAHRSAARVAAQLGRVDDAQREIVASERLFAELVRIDSLNSRWVFDHAASLRLGATLDAEGGDVDAGLARLRQAHESVSALASQDQGMREECAWRLARLEIQEGDLLERAGRRGDAEAVWRRSADRLETIAGSEANAFYSGLLAHALLSLGRVDAAAGHYARADAAGNVTPTLRALAERHGLSSTNVD